VQHFVTMLREGSSPQHCFEWVAAQGPEPTASAFRQMLDDLEQGMTAVEALDRLLQRVHSTYFERVIAVIQEHLCAKDHLSEPSNGLYEALRTELGDHPWSDWEAYPETVLVAAIADAVGFDFHQGEENKRQQLLDYLREQHLLLLLDNFEHLLAGAPVMGEMLAVAPEVTVLVTSREPLELAGEWRYVVGGMHVPETACADLDQYDAVQLFAARARQVRPDFALEDQCEGVVRLCQLVGAMPLGIELAAAWVDVLSPDEIADEISRNLDVLQTGAHDMPERHRSIKTVLNHTWIRLSDTERTVFMRLSVFRGGFTREAATQAAGASLPVLASLVNKSLVQLGVDGRYAMHELLRQYAEGHLIAQDQIDEARAAHSRYFLALLASLESDVKGRRQAAALDQTEADLENVRAAWQYAARHADYAGIGQALESIYLFFDMRNRYQEGETLLRFALDHLEASPDPDHHFQLSRIQTRRAFFLMNGRLGSPEDVRGLFERCLALARDRHDHYEIGWCLGAIGWMMFYSESDTDRETENTLQESLAHFMEANDRYQIADEMNGLGLYQCVMGNIDAGIQNLEEAYRLAREIGNLNTMIYALVHRGYYAAQAELAESNFREAIAIARQIGSLRAVAYVQYHLAFLSFFAGDFDETQRIIGEALARAEIHDYRVTKGKLLSILSLLASVADEDYERGRQFARESYTLFVQSGSMKRCSNQCRLSFTIAAISSGDYPAAREHLALAFIDNSPAMWWVVMGVCLSAILLAHAGDMKRAAALLALAFDQGEHVTGWMKQWDRLARLKTTLEHDLGTDAYRTAWEHGRTLDLDTVLEDMLTVSQAG
jgi:predicted ATPase